MTEEEIRIVKDAENILNKEGFKGYLDGTQACYFWEAVRYIQICLDLIKPEKEQDHEN